MNNPTLSTYVELYKYMVASRESDAVEAELVNSGEANFLASSKGHEGSVIVAPYLNPTDYLHCHYRDKALMLARGISSEMFFYSALAKSQSHSCGRQMVSHMSDAENNIMSIVGPVGNNALQCCGVAHAILHQDNSPIVYCAFGDGTSQQGEVLEAIAEAKRSNLPVLFFIHNNEFAISTRTKYKTFFSLPDGQQAQKFYDINISYINGTNPLPQCDTIAQIITNMRHDRSPHIIIFNVDRLDNHSNADNQQLYRDSYEFTRFDQHDPLITSYKFLLDQGVSEKNIEQAKTEAVATVRRAIEIARKGTTPQPIYDAEKPLTDDLVTTNEYRGDFTQTKRLTMLEAMNKVFDYHLATNHKVLLLGEDIEDNKGDVFGITRGLSTKYGTRVKNSALSESTIVGMCCGMALAGKLPVAFIQFADFMPVTYNQIYSELATMYWRTNGLWQCPVIIFAACGAYRPGLGPFHSQTNEATYAHIPGIDVYMPSNAADAAGLLNVAFKSGRPSIFLYPKKLLNNSSTEDTTSVDVDKQIVAIGKARIIKSGNDITLVGWGNTIELCIQAANTLDKFGLDAEIIDLRTLKPFDIDTILVSTNKTGRLIVTHEDNLTCGLGGEIIASVVEKSKTVVKVKRITRSDTYTPCNFINQLEVLPSYERILTACADMLDLNLIWEEIDKISDNSVQIVEIIGASPSDESVLISKIHVKIGQKIENGDNLVDIEASKSAGEILSPCLGIVEDIYVEENTRAIVGKPLLKVRLPQGVSHQRLKTPRKAILSHKLSIGKVINTNNREVFTVGLCNPIFKTGSKVVSNMDILSNFSGYTDADIVQRTGIKQRFFLNQDQSIIDVAVESIQEALSLKRLRLNDIDLLICTTSSPEEYQSPSTACLILNRLYAIYGEHSIAAYDINAACSGYVYGLQNAKDYLQTRPDSIVLLVTAESLSRRMNKRDFDTAFLFADAASATIVCGNNHVDSIADATIDRVYLSSLAEDGSVLNMPVNVADGIHLQGKKLFTIAVKQMALAIRKCCELEGVGLSQLNLVIPHQANQRILDAVGRRLGIPDGAVYSNIENYGNTSSSTIPIALGETLLKEASGNIIALCAFGGGFTTASALLTRK